MSSKNSKRGRRRAPSRRSEQTQINAIVKANRIVSPEPPTFESSHHYVQKFRFITQLDVLAYPINPPDFASLLAVALEDFTATSAAYSVAPIYTRYLLKSLEMYAIPSSLASPVTLVLTPQNTTDGTSANTEQTLTDTSKSIDRYAYVKYKPRLTSPAAQYQTQTSIGGGMRLTCPAGTIVDVCLHVWIANGESPGPVSVYFAPTGSVIPDISQGDVIALALDPSSTGASIFFPQGYNTLYFNADEPTPRP